MKNPKLVFRISIIFAFLVITSVISCQRVSKDIIHVGEKAPEFILPDLEGKKVSLLDFKGKVVLVEFWATWCPPCRESIPFLNSLHKEYNDKGLVITGINVDERVHIEEIKSFVDTYGIKYKVLLSDALTTRLYGVGAIPVGYLINREQKIVNKYFGYNSHMEDELSKELKELL